MMVAGERAELRGLNLEGLRRNGFTMSEVCTLSNVESFEVRNRISLWSVTKDHVLFLGIGR